MTQANNYDIMATTNPGEVCLYPAPPSQTTCSQYMQMVTVTVTESNQYLEWYINEKITLFGEARLSPSQERGPPLCPVLRNAHRDFGCAGSIILYQLFENHAR